MDIQTKGKNYNKSTPKLKPRHKVIINYLTKKLIKNKKIIDIGCASGMIIINLKRKLGHKNDYYGSDLFKEGPNLLKKNKIKYFTFDLRKTNKIKEKFDIIILSEVIEHIENFQNAMNEIKKNIKPGGMLIISTPNFSWIGYRILYLLGFTPAHLGEIDKNEPFFKRKGIDTNLHISNYNFLRLTKLLNYYGFKIKDNLSILVSLRNPLRYLRVRFWPNLFANRIIFVTESE